MQRQMSNGFFKVFIVLIGACMMFQYNAYAAVKVKSTVFPSQRKTNVTMQGKSIVLLGREMKAGFMAPDFTAQTMDLTDAKLNDFKGKIKIIFSVLSLDTPVCEAQIRKLNQEAAQISPDVEIMVISMDLPFAQKRVCEAAGIDKIKVLSDHRQAEFGKKYGALIKDLHLLTRAVFILDKNDIIRYVDYVKNVDVEPDYAAVFAELKKIEENSDESK